MYLDIVYV